MLEKQIITRMLLLIPNCCNINDSTYPLSTNLHWKTIKEEGLFGHLDDESPQFFYKTHIRHIMW
jgi:hypothetical protein